MSRYLPFLQTMDKENLTIEIAQEFHRRIATMINAIQVAIWQKGLHDLLGYATDCAFGQKRGQQTLILKTNTRSAYLRLQWETIMGDAPADQQLVDGAVASAINELS